eukprot:gnl/Chilomastix_caulleri/3645.p1 GENE.gnl/Chilomastix_caulleri/3645~~gnl/Chilomastix_caulleri/3645.p1  ORF type:complete len:136 (-),score=13.15 gnl/Chilomastix_caulleri/3645:40-447(-)
MCVEDETIVGFYDKKCIFITYNLPLREATLEALNMNPQVSSLKIINGTTKAHPSTDVSRLESTRILFYRTPLYIPYYFNVDTRENIKLVGSKAYVFPSTTGICLRHQCFFQEFENNSLLYSYDIKGCELVKNSRD